MCVCVSVHTLQIVFLPFPETVVVSFAAQRRCAVSTLSLAHATATQIGYTCIHRRPAFKEEKNVSVCFGCTETVQIKMPWRCDWIRCVCKSVRALLSLTMIRTVPSLFGSVDAHAFHHQTCFVSRLRLSVVGI